MVTCQQKKKKASNPNYKGRSKAITTVVLKEIPVTIPRGPLRVTLRARGRIKELYFHRVMSEREVNNVIVNGFEDINIKEFRFLLPMKDNTLSGCEKQDLNGTGVIKLAGSGSLYIQLQGSVSSTATDGSSHITAAGPMTLPSISKSLKDPVSASCKFVIYLSFFTTATTNNLYF